jgi:hypothetical protein
MQHAMQLTTPTTVSEALQYHLDNNLTLQDNVFRIYSEAYFALVKEIRALHQSGALKLSEADLDIVATDLGETAEYNGRTVYLDAPIYESEDALLEAEYQGRDVELNKPFRTSGESKKFAVYVKNDKDNIIKIGFGDPNLRVRNANPKAARSFLARHRCKDKKDRTKAGYWSCRVGRYAKSLGLKSGASW